MENPIERDMDNLSMDRDCERATLQRATLPSSRVSQLSSKFIGHLPLVSESSLHICSDYVKFVS